MTNYASKHSDNAINLIKQFEGFRSKPYLCPAGVATIGYGTTEYSNGDKVTLKDSPLTEQDATDELEDFVAHIDAGLYARLKNLNQNQFDALVSFIYNLGFGNFERSTLYKKLCQRVPDYRGAAEEFGKWVKAGGKTLEGLVKRRAAERALFEGKA